MKTNTGKSKQANEVKSATIDFTKSKETKNAVAFTAEGLENTVIYFKKSELPDLGLEGKESFRMVIEVE